MVFLVFWILLNLEKEEEAQTVLAASWFSETFRIQKGLKTGPFFYTMTVCLYKGQKGSANKPYMWSIHLMHYIPTLLEHVHKKKNYF